MYAVAGVRYVVDAGRSKQKILEEGGSLAQYDVRWISKASAQQRAGRSGRTGPGHCYRSSSWRLHSRLSHAGFNAFLQHDDVCCEPTHVGLPFLRQ